MSSLAELYLLADDDARMIKLTVIFILARLLFFSPLQMITMYAQNVKQ